MQIVRKPNATTTFVIFCTIRHTFGISLNLFHHSCLAKLNVNVIYLRDFKLSLFLSGISSLGDVEQSGAALRRARTTVSRGGARAGAGQAEGVPAAVPAAAEAPV